MKKSLCIGLTVFILVLGHGVVGYSADTMTQETDASTQKKMKKDHKKPALKKRDAKDLGSTKPSQQSNMKSQSMPKENP